MHQILARPKSETWASLQSRKPGDEVQGSTDLLLTQDHYTIEGSLEQKLSKIGQAFRQWRRALPDNLYSYRWANILGVTDSEVVFYIWGDDTGGYDYFTIGYSAGDDGAIAILTDTLNEVDVQLVVKTLGIGEGTQGSESSVDQDKQKEVQDAVTEDGAIGAEVTRESGPDHAGDETNIAKGPTDAVTPGPEVDPNAEVTSGSGVEKSGDVPVSGGGGGVVETDIVREALGKTAAGTKQDAEEPATEPVLLQGDAYDHGHLPMTFIQSAEVTEVDGKKQMKISGIATKGDIVNSKGEVYPLSVWKKNLKPMNQAAKAGKFLGKVEHPTEELGLQDAAIKFEKFELQGADVLFEAVVIPTEPHGKNLQAMIEAGVQIDLSSRGYGSKLVQSWRGTDRVVIQDDFVCTAFDAVWHGASTGSGVKSVTYQSGEEKPDNLSPAETQGAATVETTATTTQEQQVVQSDAQTRAAQVRAEHTAKQTREALLSQAADTLSEMGLRAYGKALTGTTDEELMGQSDTILPVLQSTFPKEAETEQAEVTQSATYQPQFFVKQSQEELAPQTVGELFDRLVQDLPEKTVPGVPNHFTSPKHACKRLMVNIARMSQGSFNGAAAARGLLALEQGKIDRAQDILLQSIATGGTVVGDYGENTGAPLSNYLIFPLIRRVYPRYIMNEIASIQPMDRPEGKIFFLDTYRTEDPAGQEKRMDLNTSANPFNSSYADNATEGAAAQIIRLKLSSGLVQAHNKKLGAVWSIEEMQDLRAYHGLDAAQELMGALGREVALEWNFEVLNDMFAQATGANMTFNTSVPDSGWTQKDWDEYIWVYIQALDNYIFSKRNGPMTHLVVGVDAALSLAKSMRGTFTIGGEDGGDMNEMYPGTTFYGNIKTPNGSRYRVFKTNFWASGTAAGKQMLGLRKGDDWSDTPYIWAPYADYVTPMLTDPADFSQKQGIISRAAKKVVVPDAIAKLTVATGTGVPL